MMTGQTGRSQSLPSLTHGWLGSLLPIVTVYVSAVLIAIAAFNVFPHGSSGGFYAYSAGIHIVFAATLTVVLVAARRVIIASEWRQLLKWLPLVAFVIYCTVRVFLYPDRQLSSRLSASILVNLGWSGLLGYAATLGMAHLGQGLRRVAFWGVFAGAAIVGGIMLWLLPYSWEGWFLLNPPAADSASYQLFGNYTVIIFTLVYLGFTEAGPFRVDRGAVEAGFVVMSLALFAILVFFLAQFFGSNSAAGVVALTGTGTVACSMLSTLRAPVPGHTRRFAAMAAAALLAAALFALMVVSSAPLRIFNFYDFTPSAQATTELSAETEIVGEAALIKDLNDMIPTSVTSRIGIFSELAMEQILIDPVFGDVGADYRVGRPGDYLHSLVSIQTHLGIVGTLLFIWFILERLVVIYQTPGLVVLKIMVPVILAVAAFSTFFLWGPLWFFVGALFALDKRPARSREIVT